MIDNNGQWYGSKTIERSSKSMPESWKIFATYRTMAFLLCATANPYNWRWNAKIKSNRCPKRCTTIFESFASHRLFESIAIWREKGILLPNCRRKSYKMFGQIKRQTISTNGRKKFEVVTKVSESWICYEIRLFNICFWFY